MSNRRNFIKATVLAAALSSIGMAAQAADTIKVGILHSLSGTMAISETALKETALMTSEEINKNGGVLGKKLEPVVVDPASNWPLFAEKARQLLAKDKVAVVFGCWTSVSRKSVLPVFKELNGLLFYPVQYEGEELERNVFYTGAAPNQQAIPAVEYLMSKDGGEAKRFVLLGTDYVYPRTTNKILRAFLKSKGVADADIMEEYTPFGHSDYQTIIAKIKKFAGEGKKTAVVSTINGDSNVPFYKELGNALGLQEGAQDLVGRARIDVIGAEQNPALGFAAVLGHQVFNGRDGLLVGGGAGVENVLLEFFTLVLNRVEEQAVQFFVNRQDGLAGNGGPAAEGHGDLVLGQQLAGLFGEQRPVGFGPRFLGLASSVSPAMSFSPFLTIVRAMTERSGPQMHPLTDFFFLSPVLLAL